MERRLAAILAADVVGYSRLMAADEAGTHARLKALRRDFIEPKIAEHHGRTVKLMGDGALVEFGSVVDAVECAVALQEGVALRQAETLEDQRIRFRIGINLGDVIIEDGDIYGDGVNVAARLEQLAEPGGVCVSRTVYNHVRNKVALAFAPAGEHRVKNIPEPVTVYRLLTEGGSPATTARLGQAGRASWLLRLAAAATLVLVSAAGGTAWWYRDRAVERPAEAAAGTPPLPVEPSIAVLPFDNLSGDPEQAYFADGMTEDLITDLSKTSGLFVIARNSSFRYKDTAVDPQQVARELGVRYLLEGSVRRVDDQVRINAQLIDATTSRHIWAERYDGPLADVFALQDRVTRKIVEALALNLTVAGRHGPEAAETTPAAYDTFLKGWEHFQKRTPEHYARALRYFLQAAEMDPDYARAHAAIAWIYWRSYWEGWHPVLGVGTYQAKNGAAEHLERAMAEPTSLAYQVAAQMRLWTGRHDAAVAEAERAVALDSSDADSRAVLAEILIYSGEPQRAITAIGAARRLDPHNQARYSYLEGFARFGLEQFDGAARLLERSLELGPDLWPAETTYREADCDPCELLLAAYGHLGRPDHEIRKVRDRLSGTWGSTAMDIRSIVAYRPFKEPRDAERLAEGLRRAGLPE